jgi:hypothetical protein
MAWDFCLIKDLVGGCVKQRLNELTLKKERNPEKFSLVRNLLSA